MTETCPVCDRPIDTEDPSETDYRDGPTAPAQVEHEGDTYRLCGDDCRKQFEGDPESYG